MDSDIWKHDRQHWRSAGASYAHRDLPDDYGPYREVRPESLTLGELRRAGKAAEFAPNKDRQYLDRDGDTWEWDSAQWVCPAWNLKKDELFDTYGPYTEIEEGPNKAKKYKDREGDVWHWTGDNWRCGDMPIYDRQLPRAFEPYTEVKEDDDA